MAISRFHVQISLDSEDKLLHLQADESSGDDVLVQSVGGEIEIIQEFSEFSKSFLITSKFIAFSEKLLLS